MKHSFIHGFQRRYPFQAVCLAFVLILLTCIARRSQVFSSYVELPLYDFATSMTWPWETGHPAVVVVAIQDSDKDIWPLTDDVLAGVLEKVLEAGAAVVGVDLLRDVPVGGDPEGTAKLARVGTDERVLWVEVEEAADGKVSEAPPFIRAMNEDERCRRSVSATFPVDGGAGSVVRRGRVAVWGDETRRYTLAALLATRHRTMTLPDKAEETVDHLFGEIGALPRSAGGYWLPSSEEGEPQFLLKPVKHPSGCFQEVSLKRFGGNAHEIPVFPLRELVDEGMDSGTLRKAFAGKVVLLGNVGKNLAADEIPVVGDAGLRGIKLHALAASQLLREFSGEPSVRYLSNGAEDGCVWLASMLALGMLLLPGFSPAGKGAGLFIILPLGVVAAGLWMMKSGLWLPMGAPLVSASVTGIGGLALLWRKVSAERKTYLDLMNSHLGPAVTAKVLARNDLMTADMEKAPETFEGTAFFADLRGYAGNSQFFLEHHSPEVFYAWLNGILRPAVEITGRHGGFVKQFAGDGIFVIFGFPPERDGGHARRAVACALELAALVPSLNRALAADLPSYYMRIGIYTGDIHASSVGGGRQTDYSFLGPTTNKAARLEGLDKENFRHLESPVRILIGGNTRMQLDHTVDVTLYRGGPIAIDKNLPAEEVWEVASPPVP